MTSTAWHTLLQSPGLMLVTLSYACVGYFQYMFFYWVDYYFEKVLRLYPLRSVRITPRFLPWRWLWECRLGGWLSDRIEHARGTPSSRKIVPMLGISAGAVLLFVGVYARRARVDRDMVFAGFCRGGNGRRSMLGDGRRTGRTPGRSSGGDPQYRRQRRWLPGSILDPAHWPALRMGACRHTWRFDLPLRSRSPGYGSTRGRRPATS